VSTHFWLGFLSGLFPCGVLTKALQATFISPILSLCLAHLILFDLIILITFEEMYELRNFSFAGSFSKVLFVSLFLGPSIPVRILAANSFDLCSCSARDSFTPTAVSSILLWKFPQESNSLFSQMGTELAAE
jgi:hypothetical protein